MYEYLVNLPEALRLHILWLYVPVAVIIISAIARSFIKNTLITTGAVFAFFVLFVLFFIGLEDKGFLLISVYYYFVSYIGCFISWIIQSIRQSMRK